MNTAPLHRINAVIAPVIARYINDVLTDVRCNVRITDEYTNEHIHMCYARLSFDKQLSFDDMRDLMTACDLFTRIEHDNVHVVDYDECEYVIGDGDDYHAVFIEPVSNQICIWVRAFASKQFI